MFNRASQALSKLPADYFSLFKVLRRRFLMQKPEKKKSLADGNLSGYLLDGLTENMWKLTKEFFEVPPLLYCDDKLEIPQRRWENMPSLSRLSE